MDLQAAAVTPPQGNPSDAAGPPLTSQETTSTSGDNSRSRLRLLYRAAAQNYASVDSYIVRLRRREQVNGRDKPEEVLQLKFRKQPFSVHLKWLGEVSAGREVVYVKGQHEDKLHTLLAAGDMPLMPAGKRIALAPDSVFVRSASRHSIYETGFGTMIERLGATIEAIEKGDPRNGTLRYVGSVKRPEFETACEEVELSIPSGCDPQLPRGGKRLAFFDMISKFPNLVITLDETGHEVEYYCFDRLEYPVRLDDDDFDPDKLWSPRKPPAPQPDLGVPGRVEPR